MSGKELNTIKEIEFRINRVKRLCIGHSEQNAIELSERFEEIDNLLFDIQDFINDLKEPNETNWEIKNTIKISFKR